ncbi:MAG: flagellar biosynthesis protein FlgD, partial [Gammaproteobacteria bacterium]
MSVNGVSDTTAKSPLDDLLLKPDDSAPKKNELGEDEFLRLMLAQLGAQDPFQPMENGEFIAQMAQFSSVQGVNEMAESMDKLVESFSASQSLQAASLVGHEVSVSTDKARLGEASPITGGFELPASTGAATVSFFDATGTLVHQQHLGQLSAGTHAFSWDGKREDGERASEGSYQVRVEYG